MAAADDWVPVSPSSGKDDWTSVSGAAPTKEFQQPGTKQALSDEAIVAKERGAIPDELKTAYYSAGEMGGFSIPTLLSAKLEQKKGQTYTDALKEQRDFVEALQRQNPKSSMAGSAVGLVGGVLTPLGPLGTAGAKAAQLAGKVGAGSTGKAIASGATIGSGFGALTGAAEKGFTEDFTPAEIAKSTAFGAITGGALAPVAEKIVSKFVKNPEITLTDPSTGSIRLTDKALETARSAFGGRLSDDDLKVLQPHLMDAFSDKGITEAAAKEALLKAQGIEASKTMATGVKAPPAAREAAQEAELAATSKIMETAEGQRKSLPESAMADVYQGAERKLFGEAQKSLEDFKNIPEKFQYIPVQKQMPDGTIHTDYVNPFSLYLKPEVEKALTKAGQPTSFAADEFPKAAIAKKALETGIGADNLPFTNEGLTVRNIMQVRKRLNGIYKGAEGEDATAVKNIIAGYDNTVDRLLNNNLFNGNTAQFQLQRSVSNSLWSNYMKKVYPKEAAEGRLTDQILQKMADPNTGWVSKTLTPEMAQGATGAINAGLMDKNLGPAVYKRIQQTIGAGTPEMETFNAAIRNNIFNATDPKTGTVTTDNLLKSIQAHLEQGTLPITLQAFGAKAGDAAATKAAQEQVSNLRQLAEAIRVVNSSAKTQLEAQSRTWELIKRYTPALVGAAVGQPHGLLPAVAGALAGQVGSHVASGASGAAQIMAERAGAPKVIPKIAGEGADVRGIPYRVYPGVRNVLPPPDQEPNYGLPQARATGGRVTTSGQLIAAMERAGKKDVQNTKPLLQSTDTAVAKALEIANQHI